MFPDEQDQQHTNNYNPGSEPGSGPGSYNASQDPQMVYQAQNPSVQQPVVGGAPATAPTVGSVLDDDDSNKKRFIIIGAVIAAFFVIIIALVVVVAVMSPKHPSSSGQTPKQASGGVGGPASATANSVQESNSVITQDLSELNANDFPSDRLSDKNLDLN